MKKALLICVLLCSSIMAGTSAHKSVSKEIMGAWLVDGSTNKIVFMKDEDQASGLSALLWHAKHYPYPVWTLWMKVIAITEEEAKLVSIRDEDHKCGCTCVEFLLCDGVLHIVSINSSTDKIEHNTAHRIDSVVRIFPR